MAPTDWLGAKITFTDGDEQRAGTVIGTCGNKLQVLVSNHQCAEPGCPKRRQRGFSVDPRDAQRIPDSTNDPYAAQ